MIPLIVFSGIWMLICAVRANNSPFSVPQVDLAERPNMINQINLQRNSLNLPLLCQDSRLTSIAQQHALDMATLDFLGHDLPTNTNAIPKQYCLATNRLQPFGSVAENVLSVYGNSSAKVAMFQLSQDAGQYANAMNPAFLYIGVGVAYNNASNKYYWAQVLSTGNYAGVGCTLQPQINVINEKNATHSYTQPQGKLNVALYPQGITNVFNGPRQGLYCTLIAFNPTASKTMALGDLPYPTVLLPNPQLSATNFTKQSSDQAKAALGAVVAALNAANASIIAPTPIPFLALPTVGQLPGSAAQALQWQFGDLALNATLRAIANVVQHNSTYLAALNGTNSSLLAPLIQELETSGNLGNGTLLSGLNSTLQSANITGRAN